MLKKSVVQSCCGVKAYQLKSGYERPGMLLDSLKDGPHQKELPRPVSVVKR